MVKKILEEKLENAIKAKDRDATKDYFLELCKQDKLLEAEIACFGKVTIKPNAYKNMGRELLKQGYINAAWELNEEYNKINSNNQDIFEESDIIQTLMVSFLDGEDERINQINSFVQKHKSLAYNFLTEIRISFLEMGKLKKAKEIGILVNEVYHPDKAL